MLASYSEYMHKKAALEEYRTQYPDDSDSIAKVQAALEAYEKKNDVAPDDPSTAREVSALTAPTEGLPSQEEISQQLEHDSPAPAPGDRAAQLMSMLDPMSPLQPQVLATMPATTHPAGDEAAKEEWVRGDLDNPNGRVIVYDAPLTKVREDLAANPLLLEASGHGLSAGARVDKGDSVEQAYQDYKWQQAADAAAKAGKTAYRYSKASYLGDGKNASLLDSLSTKIKAAALPGIEGATAFVLGVDDIGNFGAMGAASNAGAFDDTQASPGEQAARASLDPRKHAIEGSKFLGGGNDEMVGGSATSPGKSAREDNARLGEEHPALHTAGQLAGLAPGVVEGAVNMGVRGAKAVAGVATDAAEQGIRGLAEWMPSTMLWDAIAGTGEAAKARGFVASTARGTAAAATDQAVREGVQAGSHYAETGDTGTTLKDAGKRVAAVGAGGAVLHALGTGVRKGASAFGENVRWGPRYEGAPGRLEAHGVETGVGSGHIPPQVVKDAELRGRMEGGRSPLAVIASDLDQPLGDVHRGRVAKAEQAETATVSAHRATPEAGYTLPARNLVEKSIEKMRELTSAVPKKGLPGVAVPGSESAVKGIFNKNIEGVSTTATKHGVPLTVDEARSFLSPEWQEKVDLDKLSKKKGAQVWVTPRRYDSAHHDKAIELLGKSKDPHVQELLESARKDRAGRGPEYAAARDKHDAAIGAATADAESVGAGKTDKPGRVRKTVERVGKSKGNDAATPALRSAATESGDKAREQLRGALVAEDLDDLSKKAALGGTARNPLASPWNLWGLGDKAVLRLGYPITRNIERAAPGKAAAATRALAAPVRAAMKPDKEEKKAPAPERKPAKKRTPWRVARRRTAQKEEQQ